jgi:hypothetical protein
MKMQRVMEFCLSHWLHGEKFYLPAAFHIPPFDAIGSETVEKGWNEMEPRSLKSLNWDVLLVWSAGPSERTNKWGCSLDHSYWSAQLDWGAWCMWGSRVGEWVGGRYRVESRRHRAAQEWRSEGEAKHAACKNRAGLHVPRDVSGAICMQRRCWTSRFSSVTFDDRTGYSGGNDLYSYSASVRFEPWLGHQLFWLRVFVVFLSLRQTNIGTLNGQAMGTSFIIISTYPSSLILIIRHHVTRIWTVS